MGMLKHTFYRLLEDFVLSIIKFWEICIGWNGVLLIKNMKNAILKQELKSKLV